MARCLIKKWGKCILHILLLYVRESGNRGFQHTETTLHRTWNVSKYRIYITPDIELTKIQSLHYTRHRTYQNTESTLDQTYDVLRHANYITPDLVCIKSQFTLHLTYDVLRHRVYITPDISCINSQILHYPGHMMY